VITGDPALLPEQGESRDERDGDGGGDELVLLLLDHATDPHGEHLIAEVPTGLQVDGLVLPALGEKSFQILGHGLAPGVVITSVVSVPDEDRRR
jgi:hypothetical protein